MLVAKFRLGIAVLFAVLADSGTSLAEELVCPELLVGDKNLTSLKEFDANEFCVGLTKGLTTSANCTNGKNDDDSEWIFRVSRSSSGYVNVYRVFVLGPSEELSGFVPGGHEIYEMEVVTFIGLNCLAAYYPVIHRSMYHTGPRERALNSRDHNWEPFFPDNMISIRDTFMNHAGRYAVELMEGDAN